MKHFDGPRINSDVLARNDEDEGGEEHRYKVHFLSNKQVFQIAAQVEQDATHDQLGRDDPSSSLADSLNVIELNEGRPEDFERERNRTEHYFTDLAVC